MTVTGANNCNTVQSITVNEPDSITISISKTDATCGDSNGSASVQATGGNGGFTYQWSNGTTGPAISNVAPGGYGITATDTNGCNASSTVFINNIPGPAGTIAKTDVNCNGNSTGQIDLQVTDGTSPYQYTWSNGANSQDLNNIPAGSYNVTITDANGCKGYQNATITEPSGINTGFNTSSASCGQNDGEIQTNVSGGVSPYHYNWSNGDTSSTITGLSGGGYELTVTDDAGCKDTASTYVNALQGPAITTTKTDITCYGDSSGVASVSVTGGTSPYTFQWSNGQTQASISGLSAGTYKVTVNDSNNCQKTANVTIDEPSETTINLNSSPEICGNGGGMAVASVAGGVPPYSYLWSTGDTGSMIQNLTSGTYGFTVTDQNGCQNTRNVSVKGNSSLQLTTSTTPDSSGLGVGSATVNVSGGKAP